MNPIKLILLDIDGCLGSGKCQTFDIKTLLKIRNWILKNQKIPVVLCTGRSQPYAEAMLQILGSYHKNIPSIVENGCFLYYPEKSEDYILANPGLEGKLEKLTELKTLLIKKTKHFAKIEPGKEVCVSLNPTQKNSIEDFYEKICQLIPNNFKKLINTTHSSTAIDITPVGIHKGNALTFLSEKTSIPIKNMLAVGDTSGDLPILEKVGIPACPANAKSNIIALVKKRNGYVAKEKETNGVLEILQYYFQQT